MIARILHFPVQAMQQPTRRGPSASANFVLAFILAVPGAFNLIAGIKRGAAGDIICGVAALAYGLVLFTDALSLRRSGTPRMPQSRMLKIGFVCLAVYLVGTFLKYR